MKTVRFSSVALAMLMVNYGPAVGQTNPGASPLTPAAATAGVPAGAQAAGAAQFSLPALQQLAFQESPLLGVVRSEEQIATAGITTARALPNPELEIGPGRLRARQAGVSSGTSPLIGIVQPIENPRMRAARVEAALARVDSAKAQTAVTQAELGAEVRDRFAQVVRIKEQQVAFREDVALTEQIRSRVQVRVRSGEAPRFDLVRAESEVAIARKNLEASLLQGTQALSALRQVVSPSLPENFDIVVPQNVVRLSKDDFELLKESLLKNSPLLAVAQAEIERAKKQVSLEENSILPQVNLAASVERDPSVTITRIGAGIVLPLVNRREGPIAEAKAQVMRNQLVLEQRRHELTVGLQAAWAAYQASLSEVIALESGILERARAVVDIAEAAYRFGERGILEFLDAQRQFRLVRNELIAARHTLQLTRNELDRLAGR
jgi:outer membrane protein, heavy metal efflux system